MSQAIQFGVSSVYAGALGSRGGIFIPDSITQENSLHLILNILIRPIMV